MKGNRQALVLPVVVFAHVVAVVVTALVLVWLLHIREGLAFNTQIKPKIFNIHPLLMVVGFILFGGEAILAYKTVPGGRNIQKRTHLTLHLVALLTGVIGTIAVFKFHQDLSIPHFYTLHSWVGLITIILYGFQWLYSIFTFAFPHTKSSTRKKVAPWHILGGIIIFILGICASLTGLVEKFTFSKLQREQEALLMNFTGLMIILFSITVGAGVVFPHIN